MAESSGSGSDVESAGQKQNKKLQNSTAPSHAKAQKVLSVSANLAQLLPTGSVMAYQTLAPSFSNQGKCYTSNFWITIGLLVALSASCIFFAFTDSIVHNGKVYYGLALPTRLNVFNLSRKEEEQEFQDILPELKKRGLKKQDFVHAFLTVVVFLTMAFSDVGLQNCFFPQAGADTQQLLKNLPLGMAVFSSLFFTIFPSKRNFIGCSDPLGNNNETTGASSSSDDDGGRSASIALSSLQPSHVCTTCGAHS